jgi:hypothetical protein
VQPARADVLGLLIDLVGDLRQALDAVGAEFQRHLLGRQQGLVLAREAGIGLGQDALEIIDGQRIEFDPDREAALQFRNQVGGLGHVEGAAGDEQDVVGLDHAVLGRYRGAFHQRQQVALHALARHFGAVGFRARGDLVDLIEEDDAVLLDVLQRLGLDVLVVDQARGLFVGQRLHRVADLHLAHALLAAAHVLEHALDLLRQVFHAGRGEDLHAGLGRGNLDFDFLVVQFAFAQLLAEFLARA